MMQKKKKINKIIIKIEQKNKKKKPVMRNVACSIIKEHALRKFH